MSPRAGRVIKCANEKSFNVFVIITTLSEGGSSPSPLEFITLRIAVCGLQWYFKVKQPKVLVALKSHSTAARSTNWNTVRETAVSDTCPRCHITCKFVDSANAFLMIFSWPTCKWKHTLFFTYFLLGKGREEREKRPQTRPKLNALQ